MKIKIITLLLLTTILSFGQDKEPKKDSTVVFKKRVLESTEIDFLASYYKQDGVHSAVSGGIGAAGSALGPGHSGDTGRLVGLGGILLLELQVGELHRLGPRAGLGRLELGQLVRQLLQLVGLALALLATAHNASHASSNSLTFKNSSNSASEP